jgi:GrpB-like predicted nucleotidyltransferase (UPF0157 family)
MTREAPVHIVPYDPLWPDQFEQERRLLAGIIGEWLHGGIEHVGSTAVPGLDATSGFSGLPSIALRRRA